MSDVAARIAFVDTGRERFRRVPLEWPINFAGANYSAIGLKRLTAGEVASFQQMIKALPDGASFSWPIYVREDGSELPAGLIDALDADDRETLDKAAMEFLPRRFLGAGTRAADPAPRDSVR